VGGKMATAPFLFGRPLDRRGLLKAGAASAIASSVADSPDSVLASEDDRRERQARGRGGDGSIVRAAIHPAIGFARVGNSREEFFLAPEVPGGLPLESGGYKDSSGAMKRQAARFRVYGLDATGQIVRELTDKEASIEWTVHLANKKASWYQFETALDIPEAVPTSRRNSDVRGVDRRGLEVDPGPRRVSGKRDRSVFNSGKFLGKRFYLGELRTDEVGRLLVLGGRGHSFSPTGQPLNTFANNDGWVDDTSDGPVTARVRVGEREIPVDPAWVVVAPPNYAPGIATCSCTLYDVVHQAMIDSGFVRQTRQITFLTDIFPIFQRLADLQWVNRGMLDRYGWGAPEDFMSWEYLDRLSDPSTANAEFRRGLFQRFRNPNYETLQAGEEILPPMYGDAITLPPESARSYLAFQPFQYEALKKWADGDFVMGVPGPVVNEIQDLPLQMQGAALDRAALEACLGDAFHPGCEVTWPIRNPRMYQSAYRLKHASNHIRMDETDRREERDDQEIDHQHDESGKDWEEKDWRGDSEGDRYSRKHRLSTNQERDYGGVLTPAVALSAHGPLDGNLPGSLTRWMAVPWQVDTVSCNSGYQYQAEPVDPYLPTFWPARVPNHVMTEHDYQTVLDSSIPSEDRWNAFSERALFFRDVNRGNYFEALQRMVDQWYRLGIVAEQPGPADPEFPSVFQVETENDF
ncbi:MAG: LodA/GoxA family CTQ-dependent oxidase, partial [Rubripirellula sp.]